MQRFVPIGRHRIQVVGGLEHDESDARRVAQTITALRPDTVVLATDLETWRRPDRLDPFDELLLRHVSASTERHVLWGHATTAARQVGCQVAVLHEAHHDPPRKGLKALTKLLKREGFDPSGSVQNDTARFVQHYVARVPELTLWMQETRARHAARLKAAIEARPKRVVAVMDAVHMDAVCDMMQG